MFMKFLFVSPYTNGIGGRPELSTHLFALIFFHLNNVGYLWEFMG